MGGSPRRAPRLGAGLYQCGIAFVLGTTVLRFQSIRLPDVFVS